MPVPPPTMATPQIQSIVFRVRGHRLLCSGLDDSSNLCAIVRKCTRPKATLPRRFHHFSVWGSTIRESALALSEHTRFPKTYSPENGLLNLEHGGLVRTRIGNARAMRPIVVVFSLDWRCLFPTWIGTGQTTGRIVLIFSRSYIFKTVSTLLYMFLSHLHICMYAARQRSLYTKLGWWWFEVKSEIGAEPKQRH